MPRWERSAGRLFEVQHPTDASYQAMLDGDAVYRALRDPAATSAERLRLHARLRELATPVGVVLFSALQRTRRTP